MKNVAVSADEETHRLARIRNPKASIYLPLLLTLAFIISCRGTAADPVVVEKEAPREVVVVKEAAKVAVMEHDRLGSMLTDADGRFLYLLARDRRGVSTCTGLCARIWPPLLTVDDPLAGDGVSVGDLGTVARSDGSRQVTYDGRPLHQFSGDDKPGDTNGHGMGEVWFVVNPELPLTIVLSEQNSSGQSGWATLTPVGDRTLVVLTRSTGAREPEPVHINEGPCGNETIGPVVYTLNFFVAGSGRSVSTVDVPLDSLQSGGFAINSHTNGYKTRSSLFPKYTDEENLIGGEQVSTSCVNIPVETDSIAIALGEQNDSGQSGRATLIARGDQTEVVLELSSGRLRTEEVHIHQAACANDTLGPAVHPLTSFAGGAGSSVTTLDVPLASLRTGGFAIVSHLASANSDSKMYGGSPELSTACGSIPAGR